MASSPAFTETITRTWRVPFVGGSFSIIRYNNQKNVDLQFCPGYLSGIERADAQAIMEAFVAAFPELEPAPPEGGKGL